MNGTATNGITTNGATTNGTTSPRHSTARLDGKVAIVTGAGKGIGAGIARELFARGASVVVSYNSSATAANALVADLNGSSNPKAEKDNDANNGPHNDDHNNENTNTHTAIALQADVTSIPSIDSLFTQSKSHYGHIDIVISNSGTEHFSPLPSTTAQDFDAVFALNTRAQFFVAQAAFSHLSNHGRLILMSSISAHNAIKHHAVYAGSKCAVEAFARCLAPEFGERGVTVNSIAPGGVKTDMAADVGWRYIPGADSGWGIDEIEAFVSKRTPMGRMALPVDVGRVVGFLASEDGGWVSGESCSSL